MLHSRFPSATTPAVLEAAEAEFGPPVETPVAIKEETAAEANPVTPSGSLELSMLRFTSASAAREEEEEEGTVVVPAAVAVSFVPVEVSPSREPLAVPNSAAIKAPSTQLSEPSPDPVAAALDFEAVNPGVEASPRGSGVAFPELAAGQQHDIETQNDEPRATSLAVREGTAPTLLRGGRSASLDSEAHSAARCAAA
jgi:hypothetical protein